MRNHCWRNDFPCSGLAAGWNAMHGNLVVGAELCVGHWEGPLLLLLRRLTVACLKMRGSSRTVSQTNGLSHLSGGYNNLGKFNLMNVQL